MQRGVAHSLLPALRSSWAGVGTVAQAEAAAAAVATTRIGGSSDSGASLHGGACSSQQQQQWRQQQQHAFTPAAAAASAADGALMPMAAGLCWSLPGASAAAACSTSGSGVGSSATRWSSSSGSRFTSAWPAAATGAPRAYGTRRPNGLSTRAANNLAGRLAAKEVLGADWRAREARPPATAAGAAPQQQQAPQPTQPVKQKRRGPIIETALPPGALTPHAEPPEWTAVGRVAGPYRVDAQDAFAVVELGPFQYKVTAGDLIYHPQIAGAEVDDVLALRRVLLAGSPRETAVGRPHLPGAAVIAAVESHFRDAKVHVFKKKPRKRYAKLRGHRDRLTALRVLQVLPEGLPDDARGAAAHLRGGGGGGGADGGANDGAAAAATAATAVAV